MGKKQTRRSISVRGTTYFHLKDFCGTAALSMSDFIEQRITEYFHGHPEFAPPPAAKVAAREPQRLAKEKPVTKVASTVKLDVKRDTKRDMKRDTKKRPEVVAKAMKPQAVATTMPARTPARELTTAKLTQLRSVPAASTLTVKRPVHAAALRVSAPPVMPKPSFAPSFAPTTAKLSSVTPLHPEGVARGNLGRPAPTPAAVVLKGRPPASEERMDYRGIRF